MLTAKQKEDLKVKIAAYIRSAAEVKSPFVETLPESATSKSKLPGEAGGLKTENKMVKLPGDPNEFTTKGPAVTTITKGETATVKPNKEKMGVLPIDPDAFTETMPGGDSNITKGEKGNTSSTPNSDVPKGVQQMTTVPISWNKYRVPEEKAPFKKQFSQVNWFKKQAELPATNPEQQELVALKDRLSKGETLTQEEMAKVNKAQTPGA